MDYTVRQKIGVDGIGVFIEALSTSIKTYLTSGNVPAEHINRGLEFLSDTFGEHCMQIAREHKGEDTIYPPTPSWEILQKITDFIGNDLIFLVERNEWDGSVLQRENSADDDNGFLSQVSISSGIAEVACRAFSQLAQIGKAIDGVLTYHAIVKLLDGMILENRAFSEGYRQRFETGIWRRIRPNVAKRHYPATLRVYLEFLGLLLLSNSENQSTWIQNETERVRRLLYVDLKPLFESKEKMINGELMQDALLPQAMRYMDGKFYYRVGFGKGAEHEISEPPNSSPSVLEEVTDEHIGW